MCQTSLPITYSLQMCMTVGLMCWLHLLLAAVQIGQKEHDELKKFQAFFLCAGARCTAGTTAHVHAAATAATAPEMKSVFPRLEIEIDSISLNDQQSERKSISLFVT